MAKAKKEERMSLADKLAALSKKYPKTVIMGNSIEEYDVVISTGSLDLDIKTGIGGIPLSHKAVDPATGFKVSRNGKIIEIWGWESTGKAQPLHSKILTPNGWTTMKEVEVGTIISTPDGSNTTIIAIHPQGQQEVYKVTLDDGSSTLCTKDHLWFVNSRRSELGEVLSTKELLNLGLTTGKKSKNKWKIPNTAATQFEQLNEITINPYLLGLLLGDGGLTDNSNVKITLCDLELVDKIKTILKSDYDNVKLSKQMGQCGYSFKKIINSKEKTSLFYELEKLYLIGKYSYEKHIPQEYLLTSINNRIELLRGLMDSDGTCSSDHSFSFSTSSKLLSQNFEELVRSLGCRVTTSSKLTKYKAASGEYLDGKISYRSSILLGSYLFNPFSLERKSKEFNNLQASSHSSRFIESIELIGIDECQCITVAHKDQLYITDDYIVTHNSTLTQTIMGNAQKDGRNVLLLNSENSLSSTYSSRLGLNLDQLIVIQIDDTGGEEAYKKAQELIKTGEIDLVVIDSYNKIRPLKELENAFSGGQMGNFAKLMGEACNDAMKNCTAYGTTTIFVGQVREKIGVMFGSPETTQGGNALRFDAHMRFKTKRSTTKDNSDVNEDDEKISNLHGVDIEKNKMASPFRKASFDIIYGEGINKYKEISDIGPKYLDNLKTRGTTVTFDDVKYDQEGFWDMLKNNPELYEELRAKILKAGLQKPLPEDKPITEIEKELVETLADNIDNV